MTPEQRAHPPLGGPRVTPPRPVDEYGREIYRDNEVPPVDAPFAQWMGLTCATYPPTRGNSVGGCHPTDGRRPYAACYHGWVRSGRWWLHCLDCHPADVG